jgi:hypothetical protein
MRTRLLTFGRFANDSERGLAGILVTAMRLKIGSYFALHFLASRVPIQKDSAALVALVATNCGSSGIQGNQLSLSRHAHSVPQTGARRYPCGNQTAPVPGSASVIQTEALPLPPCSRPMGAQ